ncbi:MAG: VanZ family protein [Acidobacteria bacterium]|nr:MAG: VanZ family protein [Acidobacteriota bacterium]
MSDRPDGTAQWSYWFPAIFVAILISVFSIQYFAAERTGRVILPVLHWLFPWATRGMLHLMHFGIRKTAHVTEFGIFSITVFRGVRAGRSGWKFNWAFTTLVIAVLYAALDEWHQSFVVLRHATPRDAAIDAIGALLAQCFVWGYATRRWPFTALFLRNAGSAKKQEEMTR